MVHTAKRNSARCPTHRGALLREDVIPSTGRTKAEIAQLLGISRQHLYDILRERKPVSPAVAVRLGKLFGDGAGVWVRMQAAYDTRNAERKANVSKIPTLRAKAALIYRSYLIDHEGRHLPVAFLSPAAARAYTNHKNRTLEHASCGGFMPTTETTLIPASSINQRASKNQAMRD
jgi:addiction module HigA family antidote